MNVPLRRDDGVVEAIRTMFASRGREMPDSNLRQADVPEGATDHPPDQGDRPRAHLPGRAQGDLRRPRGALRDVRHVRAGHRPRPAPADGRAGRDHRGHRQPGHPHLGHERVGTGRDPGRPHRRARRPDGEPSAGAGRRRPATIAFLASGIEGIKVRVTVRADDDADRPPPCSTPRRRRSGASCRGRRGRGLRDRRRGHRGRRGPGPGRRGPHPGPGRVAHRRAGRLAAGQRARGQPVVPGLGGVVRLGGQVRRPRACPRARWCPRRRPGPWPTAPAGSSEPTWVCPSPGWPDPTPRTTSRPAPCSWAWPVPGTTPSRSASRCPATGTGSASTPPSPPSTCCAATRRSDPGLTRGPTLGRSTAGGRRAGCVAVVVARRSSAAAGVTGIPPAPARPSCCRAAG